MERVRKVVEEVSAAVTSDGEYLDGHDVIWVNDSFER